MDKKELIAMILAGGQGSRLGVLTKRIAKPAVPFGGKYRIIDFVLSNCSNSGIDTVGVLTQYKPFTLNKYIGIGRHWDLDRKKGGIFLLPPYQREKGGEWYKGTANAIYQNMDFADLYNPQYVVILSGDHIYKMDYDKMLDFHKEKEAEVTIAVIEVPWEEANRFGIMNTNQDDRIIEFEEKPSNPKSNKASMGVYIFDWELLKQYLMEDEMDKESANDFGKNIIPKMVKDERKVFAYPFVGYWRDVGTIESLWEASMDLLTDRPELDLYDSKWRIYSVNPTKPPHYVAPSAKIRRSLINEGCLVYGEVDHSIVFPGVLIGEGCHIKDSIIMPNVRIGKGTIIEKAIIGEETIIGEYCHIGGLDGFESPQKLESGITVIGEHLEIAEASKIQKNSVISIEIWSDGRV